MSISRRNKSSKGRRDQRRANWKMKTNESGKMQQMWRIMMPHRVCKACGSYNKREIVNTAE